MTSIEHTPVLLNEVIAESKNLKRGWFVDCTLGGGGHFFALSKINQRLLGLDVDRVAYKNILNQLLKRGYVCENSKKASPLTFFRSNPKSKIIVQNSNFTNFLSICKDNDIKDVSLVLADLNLNSYQIKKSGRGFSFRDKKDVLLDMRFDIHQEIPTAADLVNGLSVRELTELFKNFGEVRLAKIVAQKIIKYRLKFGKITTVGDFLKSIDMNKEFFELKIHPATKIFMALRIAVNSEFSALQSLLGQSLFFINQGAKLLIISFHSIEQKIIEDFANKNDLALKKERPTLEEVQVNSSSRSAILNVITSNNE